MFFGHSDCKKMSVSLHVVVLLWVVLVYHGGDCTGPPTCTHTISLNSTSGRNVFSEALGRVKSLKRSVCVKLSEGQFYLDSAVNATLVDVHDISITGINGAMDNTVVNCSNISDVGITVLNSTGISFFNVKFENCGGLHNSTSRNFNHSDFSHLEFLSALYFSFSSDVTMTNVTLFQSASSGLVLYNHGGTNIFTHCVFSASYSKGPGGTGVTIDNSYCAPGDVDCAGGIINTNATHTFKDCEFSYNIASSDLGQNNIYPHGRDHMVFGKGGGVSISFGGHSFGNIIKFERCNFMLNEAIVGGGLYVLFGDVSVNNTLTIVDSTFDSNTMDCLGEKSQWTVSGEGVKIEFIYYRQDFTLWPGYISQVENNKVEFLRSNFSNSYGCYGSALSLVTSRNQSEVNSNSLLLDTCRFESNKAQLSSAVDLSLHYPDSVENSGRPVQPVFSDCTFENNLILPTALITNYALGMGALYSARVPFTLTGHNRFINNDGTAMVVLSAYVIATNNSFTEFIRNKGRLGGAMSFIGQSWLVSYPGSSFSFINNSVAAGGLGGAIYSVQFGEHDIEQNCFFQYYKPTIPPHQWNTSYFFSGNTANELTNSIYTTSLGSCQWPSNQSTTNKRILDDVFCNGHPWKFFKFNCTEQIKTASASLKVPSSHRIHAIPGWSTTLGVQAIDDYNKPIPTVLVAYPDDNSVGTVGVNASTRYISNDKIILYGKENTRSIVKFRTLDPRVVESKLSMQISACPPGFLSVYCKGNDDMVCDCVCPNEPIPSDMLMNCDRDDENITLNSHFCLTYQYDYLNKTAPNKSLPLVIGHCPFNNLVLKLPRSAEDLDRVLCQPLHRTGLLCSQCIENYSVAINGHFECVPCNPAIGWLLFLLVKILPVTLLFFLVALLNFKTTSPAMNAFVFFAQIVTVSHYQNPFPFYLGVLTFKKQIVHKTLIALVRIPYGILNLDFFEGVIPPFCIGNVSTVTALFLRYVVAVYPLLLIFICYVSIKLNDRNVRIIREISKPINFCIAKIRKKTKATASIIDTIATFLLFSYTTFVYVSFPLLNFISVYDTKMPNFTPISNHQQFFYDATLDFGTPKSILIFAIVIVIIVLFVVFPPLFFILYPLKFTQRCINRLPKNIAIKTFAECFTECYRNGTEKEGKGWDFRYFAGLYFLFRIILLLAMVITPDSLSQYFAQQVIFMIIVLLFSIARPYKVDRYNDLDTAIFSLLSLLNACSMYNSQKQIAGDDISLPLFIFNYVLMFVPLFYLVFLIARYCSVSFHCCRKKYKGVSESIIIITEAYSSSGEEESFVYDDSGSMGNDVFPDRVLNPKNYSHLKRQKNCVPKRMVTKKSNDSESDKRPRQGTTENSFFLEQEHRQNYGTVQRSQTEPQEFRKLA